jgi:hypothetical protein
MAPETGPNPKPEADRLRDRLLDQWEPSRTPYLAYRKEIETMLENQEKALRREKSMTDVLWVSIVGLTTIMLMSSGLPIVHKVEVTFMAVTVVLCFLFGHQINKSRFEVIKEIKGVELRLAALEERFEGRGDGDGPSS